MGALTPPVRRLLAWYARHGRALPWRGARDPYHIWVSEVMLQQTQVDTALPYYERFIARWPTMQSLAAAPLDDVLKMWEGLGYYARARNLHKGVQLVVREMGAQLPGDVAALRRIPGIGRYMAGALASLVFGLDEPALDGNLRRVLARLFAVRGDAKSAAVEERLWTHARALLPRGRAGDFNQALMDLGARICVPRRPRCLLCPVQTDCRALAEGVQDELPEKTAKKKVPHHQLAVPVVFKRERVLIAQRPADGLLGGMWEFPGGRMKRGESAEAACRRVAHAALGLTVRAGEPIATVDHAFSHMRVTLHAVRCEYASGEPNAPESERVRWARLSELERFAWPVAQRKIIEVLHGGRKKRIRE
ncbi:MAG: A/G-specific adenine glycosylase [Chloroflexi bacterium]|nr:A/G-specific adenine glycosylase [Chloroflexota bacterium]